MHIDAKMLNVLLLGFAFMFIFTSFQTMTNVEKTVLNSISQEDPNFKGDAFISQAIIYAVFAITNWLAPSFVKVFGPRLSMVIGSLFYIFFIVSFLWPNAWLLYLASGLLGLGAAVIWTGQGNFLTLNSDSISMARNSGIFWAMFQMSLFIGNVFIYFKFQGINHIDENTRTVLFTVLTIIGVVGAIFTCLLRPVAPQTPTSTSSTNSNGDNAVQIFIGAVRLFFKKEMLFLAVTFFYTGIVMSFFSGIYGSCIAFTKQLGDNTIQLVGLSGILVGLGEVIGGALFGIFGSKTIHWGRYPIIILGFLLHIVAFVFIYLNLPNNSPFDFTNDVSVFTKPSAVLAVTCSFLLGFGDSCFNTQIYSLLGTMFSTKSAEAFALFKFTQSLSSAISFFYAKNVGLYPQLIILSILAIGGTITFLIVEKWSKTSHLEPVETLEQ